MCFSPATEINDPPFDGRLSNRYGYRTVNPRAAQIELNTDVSGSPVCSHVRYQMRSHIGTIKPNDGRKLPLILNFSCFVNRIYSPTVPAAAVENTSAVGFNTSVIR